jgi:putative flippase GtrA
MSIGRFAGYAIVGAIGTALHAACTVAFVEILGLHPVVATATGFGIALVVQYLLNNAFVFRAGAPDFAQFLRYSLVSFFGLALNLGIMYTVVEILRWPYQAGIVIGIFVVTPVNFLLNRAWSFRQAGGRDSVPKL